MKYLVDTNVISEIRKGPRCHQGVASFFKDVDSDSLFLSLLTLGELRKGIESLRGRDRQQAERLDAWLGNIKRFYANRILPIESEIAERWGSLNTFRTYPVIDGLLAATALVHGFTLVTRNWRDLAGSGVAWFDPFDLGSRASP